jgi:hypothetical protein
MLVHIFYGHLDYFTDIWDVSLPAGTFYDHLVHFSWLWCHAPRKIWQPRIRDQKLRIFFSEHYPTASCPKKGLRAENVRKFRRPNPRRLKKYFGGKFFS